METSTLKQMYQIKKKIIPLPHVYDTDLVVWPCIISFKGGTIFFSCNLLDISTGNGPVESHVEIET